MADEISNEAVAALIDLSRSANVFFELINDRVTVRAVNPRWSMWRPVSTLLDQIGAARIETYLRDVAAAPAEPAWPGPREAMLRWSAAMGYRG